MYLTLLFFCSIWFSNLEKRNIIFFNVCILYTLQSTLYRQSDANKFSIANCLAMNKRDIL